MIEKKIDETTKPKSSDPTDYSGGQLGSAASDEDGLVRMTNVLAFVSIFYTIALWYLACSSRPLVQYILFHHSLKSIN